MIPGLFKGRNERTGSNEKCVRLPCRAERSLRFVKKFRVASTENSSKRKEDSSRGSFRRGPVALRRRVTPSTQFRNFNRIPFRCIVRSMKNETFNPFGMRLGATHPRPIAVHAEPFSTSVFKGLT
jgi:hypothetical protein